MKIEELAVWEAFRAVANQGGFSKAAQTLKISVSQLSKRIAKLEDRLGTRLFARTTRRVVLTDEGKSLLPKLSSVLDDLASLESSFTPQTNLSGKVRMTCVPFVAQRLLLPVIAEYRKAHPGVEFELELSEVMVNLIESNIDLAIRIHDEPSDSSLVYRKLVPNQLVLCASPAYLKKCARPIRNLGDLRNHPVLSLAVHDSCSFQNSKHRLGELAKFKPVSCENGWYLTELALRDFGILVRSIWDVRDHLKSGKLVRVLPHHPLETFGYIFSVIPTRKYLAPRTRAFLDLLAQHAEDWSAGFLD